MGFEGEELLVFSPAKINLALKVLERRQDGYHDVETVYQMLKFGDVLHVRRQAHEFHLSSTHPGLSCGPDNLVWKSASALSGRCGVPLGARVMIEKRIPIAAGLGGGSSNAAAALLGLNALYRLGLGGEELSDIARTLGADIPFFLSGPAALGTGRGDVLRLLQPGLEASVLLVCPHVELSTKAVYEKLSSPLTPHPYDITLLVKFLHGRELAGIGDLLYNDLEAVSVAAHPVICTIKDRLRDLGAEGALMSGSGPAVFGLFRDRAAARRAGQALERSPWQVIETETLTEVVPPYVEARHEG